MKSSIVSVAIFGLLMVLVSASDCSERTRTRTGECNNLLKPDWGTTANNFLRQTGSDYPNKDSIISYPERPHPRVISNRIFRQGGIKLPEPLGFNLAYMAFAQFISHDLADNDRISETPDRFLKVPETPANSESPDVFCFPPRGVPVPEERPITDESCGGIFYFNSSFVRQDGTRQIVNKINSYIDLSPIYGNTAEIETKLRRGSAGELKTQDYINHTSVRFPPRRIFKNGRFMTIVEQTGTLLNYLPNKDTTDVPLGTLALPVCQPFQPVFVTLPSGVRFPVCFPKDDLIVSGDGRVTENLNLHMFHLVFFREHNRLARQLAIQNPSWTDDQLFKEAQRINIAQYQKLVYNDFANSLFGSQGDRYPVYTEYRDDIKPETTLEFTTAAFRLHTMVCDVLPTPNECGQDGRVNQDSLLEEPEGFGFCGGRFAAGTPLPILFDTGKFEHIIRGMTWTPMQKMDQLHADGIRELRAGFLDIPSISIERGRDNGLPDYDTVRQYYLRLKGNRPPQKVPGWSVYQDPKCKQAYKPDDNTDPVECFSVITSNQTLATRLQNLYKRVDNIDAFVGLRVEDRVEGSMFGPTSLGILGREFWVNRATDRFYYANPDMFSQEPKSLYSSNEIDQINQLTLSQLFERNFELQLQTDAFKVPDDQASLYPDTC